jgi:hypothetical protein
VSALLGAMAEVNREREQRLENLWTAVLYALLIRWGAMRNLHNRIAELRDGKAAGRGEGGGDGSK